MTIGERLRHEARQIGLVTLYFLACFGFFLALKKLLLEEYDVTVYVFHAAVIGALVVAKVVVLLEKTSFGGRFQGGSLAAHVIWRSLAYTAVVLAVTSPSTSSRPGASRAASTGRSQGSGPAGTFITFSP